ncbi:uncharacterized protein BP01DRAFT_401137 [Aspergillus saccharolyticus JOP 1030-1]|uniref:DUF7905 domain-containing protein n=1 Tax=Aspergillus saccharolyticus JOP 1030-1 TaxID=1450539 RepID=A0A318ZD04_9EURO|nr:hypothetical protein BP01DRAFT_401137 [Aspergillus saccharolyticus JOP 1030-1]PYH44447.1 hypothetical protein BP01DRAFT_401137 [Aspergillus saccharolyticus JOP 1030-1]
MDFEASGAQEWALPGYGRPESQNNRPEPENSKMQNATKTIPSTASASVRGTARPPRARCTIRGRRGSTTPQAHLPGETPAKAQWRNGKEPAGIFKLPGPFKEIRDAGSSRRPFGQQGRNDVFDDICRKTGAYICPPAGDQEAIRLWGGPYQVSQAIELIQSIFARCESLALPKERKWTRTTAYSVGKEELADQLELEDALLQAYRKDPGPNVTCFEKLLFLWPKEGPSLKNALGAELEALDPIRVRFECHLFVLDDLPDHICVVGYAQGKTGLIVQLLRNKWAEIMANSLVRSKLYLVEPFESGQGEVSARREGGLTRAAFRANSLNDTDMQIWADRAELIRSKNNARLLNVVDRFLKGVIYVRGHLRMRVNLGLFVLDRYRVPSEGKPAWSFEELWEMLLHENTKGRLVPGLKIDKTQLLPRLLAASDLLQPYDRTEDSLRQPEPAFSVNFEFTGQQNSLLRLEAEFAKCPGAHDYGMIHSRWLKPRKVGHVQDSRSPLQVGVIDFERSDWQLEVASLEFYEASAVEKALREFSQTIKFKPNDAMSDISATPTRKVLFHSSAPVFRFIEKTSIRYRLKGTRYILEIARYDEYTRKSAIGPASLNLAATFEEKPRISWGASIFDFAWDNLLGKHANMSVGQTARYDPTLQTFFPASIETDDKSQGLWEFVALVKRVAAVLGSGPPATVKSTVTSKEANGRSASPASSGNARALDADLGTLF